MLRLSKLSKRSEHSAKYSGRTLKRESGATLLEFMLTIGVFLMLVFSIIEVARYMAIRGLLTKSANVALSLAQKSAAYHCDLRPGAPACGPGASVTGTYDDIAKVAQTIATSAFISAPGSGKSAELATYQITHSNGANSVGPVLILRPLEEGLSQADGVAIPNPTTTGGDAATAWVQLQTEHPYEVRMKAKVVPLLPWPVVPNVFNIEVKVRGYSEVPRTTRIPPALGLPLPPMPTTTTTTTVTTAPTTTTTTTEETSTTVTTTTDTAPTTTEETTTTSTTMECVFPGQMCGGTCITCTPPETVQIDTCGCGCGDDFVLCGGNCVQKCGGGTYMNDSTCQCGV